MLALVTQAEHRGGLHLNPSDSTCRAQISAREFTVNLRGEPSSPLIPLLNISNVALEKEDHRRKRRRSTQI